MPFLKVSAREPIKSDTVHFWKRYNYEAIAGNISSLCKSYVREICCLQHSTMIA